MADIRPLQQIDLPEVADLLDKTIDNWIFGSRGIEFLTGTLIDDPWSDEELPSLVAVENGRVAGFIGSQVRRFRLEDRSLRAVCASHLAVDPEHRGGATGAILLRNLLSSGQDFTFSDTANDDVARMWHTFGGCLDHARACDWMIVIRPFRWVAGVGRATIRRRGLSREQVPVGAFPFQAAGPLIARRAFPEQDRGIASEHATTADLVEALPEITAGLRLRPDYDEGFLDHVFAHVESQRGPLVRRMVRREGRPIGWYGYLLPNRGNVCRVLNVTVSDRHAEAVVGDLISNAEANGCAVVTGRLEPHLLVPLRRRVAILGFARQPVLHTHDPEIAALLGRADSLLTLLESEWFAT